MYYELDSGTVINTNLSNLKIIGRVKKHEKDFFNNCFAISDDSNN